MKMKIHKKEEIVHYEEEMCTALKQRKYKKTTIKKQKSKSQIT